MSERYSHQEVEQKAQAKWAELGLYQTDLEDSTKDPYYLLVEFPYPSGDLHIGHWYAFAVTDIYARLRRMQGSNVLFPIGFDAFGLPAENAAIKHGLDPKEWTYKNIERMRTQLRSMGPSFDWSKEVLTCDPTYYKWTQWLFTKLLEHNLAYRSAAVVKWCPKDQTVLANEQVVDGCCERCGTEVEEKRLTQWFLKITDYAERLLSGLEKLPWREEIKDAQRAWIGKSEGAHLTFALSGREEVIRVFTTRPETIFGATYVVLAPESALAAALLADAANKKEVEKYIKETTKKTERERSENKEKTGVKLEGISAINPATKQEIPLYIADYVIGSYGTGAVMAVPAHDERDFEFAKKMGLPIRQVVEEKFIAVGDAAPKPESEYVKREAICAIVRNPKDDTYLCISWKGMLMHGLVTGGVEDGEDIVEAAKREIHEETGYKNLRFVKNPDIAINTFFYHRVKEQNRWAHFHYVYFELENEERDPVSEADAAQHDVLWKTKEELKDFFTVFEGGFILKLLENPDYCYTGSGILGNSGEFSTRDSEEAKWDIVSSVGGERTTQYRLRDWLVSRQRYWGCPIPVVYDPEGKPHAIPAEHLPWLLPTDVDFKPNGKAPLASSTELQERVTRIFGAGWTPEFDTLDTFVDSSWYFNRYLDSKDDHDFSNQTLLKKWLPVNRYSGGAEHTTMHLLYARFFTKALYDLALVPVEEPFQERFNRGLILGPDGQKMSKSKGNVINPDEFVEKFGADAVRIYLAFIGPYNEPGSYPWNLDGVASMRKFLDRVVRMVEKNGEAEVSAKLARTVSQTITKVAGDGDRFKFNTAVSALMILLNELETLPIVPHSLAQNFVLMLAPFAPHVSEHLWEVLGGEGSVHTASWPQVEAVGEESEVSVTVQVNGKKRGAVMVSPAAPEEEVVVAARKIEAVENALGAKAPSRVIYVPGKILNLVAN